eukprot:NODE_33_length_36935_cov_1.609241.p30 type:complete len:113 gc:universal NODE_33_length_36935_cov_1.609241:15603-15265(-)
MLLRRFASKIIISESAAQKLRTVKGILRIEVSSGGCHGFSYDVKLDSKIDPKFDEVIQSSDVSVVVDKMALDLIKGSTLQYRTTAMGSAFSLDNPNSESSCGCGHSFSIKEV